ncbi:hypothetical protein, partial [Streptomyces sp. NPDC006999]|uniref:hypothetical protein n=1 Tax=Streptomyces sp. NPDC006999 TaxID=3156909 RepID=UPI003411EEE0
MVARSSPSRPCAAPGSPDGAVRRACTTVDPVELLLDPDTPFLELSPLAAWGSEYTVGASLV